MTLTFDLFQILIATLGLTGMVFAAFNRIFLACLFSLPAYVLWLYTTPADRAGSFILLCAWIVLFTLGLITRLPKLFRPSRKELEEKK